MKRATVLLAAVERIEHQVMAQSVVAEIEPQTVRLIVAEVVCQALDELVHADKAAVPRSPEEADAASAQLVDEIRALRQALRLRDGSPARPATQQAMATLGLAPTGDLPAAMEREALGGLIDVRNAAASLDDGQSQATREVRTRYLDGRNLQDLQPPVMRCAAIAAAERLALSSDMARKIQGTGKLMLAWKRHAARPLH